MSGSAGFGLLGKKSDNTTGDNSLIRRAHVNQRIDFTAYQTGVEILSVKALLVASFSRNATLVTGPAT